VTFADMPTVSVEVGFSVGANTGTYLHLDDSARGLLDTGTLAPDEVWTDITAYLHEGSTSRGSDRVTSPVMRYEAGSATIVLDDSDRRFDPDNLSGPYVSGGVTQVTAMRAVRVRATWDGTTYDLFRGFADDWVHDDDVDSPNYTRCTLTATDAFDVLSNHSRAAVAAVGASENTGARVGRILDSVSWPAADRVIATGDSTLQATTLDGDALAELQLAVDSELGELYMDGAGRVVFRNRQAFASESRSNTSQATFGDGGGAELPYTGIGRSSDRATMANLVRVTRVGGSEQTATDSASVQTYLTKTFERSDLIVEDDTTAANLAAWVLHIAAEPETRFTHLEISPRRDAATLWPHALGRELGDRITIKRRPAGGGSAISKDSFIRGISHEFTPDWWTTTWGLQSASKFGSFLVLDNTTLGVLDSSALAY
jgi:hypothetical protein